MAAFKKKSSESNNVSNKKCATFIEMDSIRTRKSTLVLPDCWMRSRGKHTCSARLTAYSATTNPPNSGRNRLGGQVRPELCTDFSVPSSAAFWVTWEDVDCHRWAVLQTSIGWHCSLMDPRIWLASSVQIWKAPHSNSPAFVLHPGYRILTVRIKTVSSF